MAPRARGGGADCSEPHHRGGGDGGDGGALEVRLRENKGECWPVDRRLDRERARGAPVEARDDLGYAPQVALAQMV